LADFVLFFCGERFSWCPDPPFLLLSAFPLFTIPGYRGFVPDPVRVPHKFHQLSFFLACFSNGILGELCVPRRCTPNVYLLMPFPPITFFLTVKPFPAILSCFGARTTLPQTYLRHKFPRRIRPGSNTLLRITTQLAVFAGSLVCIFFLLCIFIFFSPEDSLVAECGGFRVLPGFDRERGVVKSEIEIIFFFPNGPVPASSLIFLFSSSLSYPSLRGSDTIFRKLQSIEPYGERCLACPAFFDRGRGGRPRSSVYPRTRLHPPLFFFF